ncbi:MAG: PIG-L family deacetylase [Deltaproteobacteria bacterium]|nr:PIG-L family deacetylase [Deltaproteobacteria bacterium]MBZ0219847.1 PIG-L family deacetylase [Deltaproteobacteria bacterium]
MRSRELRFIRTSFMGYVREFVKDIFGEKTLVVAAHPDDEVAGAGALLRYLERAFFVHVTDGAPRDLADAVSHGFSSAEEYAEARRKELFAALSISGIRPEDCFPPWVPDREAGYHLVEIALKLRDAIMETGAESVLTLAYEGGHPDHDSLCFAAHAAAGLIRKAGGDPPPLIEYALYNAMDGRLSSLEFIPREGFDEITFMLSEEERRIKGRMMDCFATQAPVLSMFPLQFERFRPAPPYVFTASPHEGRLHYEQFDWGIDGKKWRELASGAMKELGTGSPM